MKKSLLLGSAAALVIAPAAFAADLPVVEPVEYVKVCDAFGAGFHYIPGTETCLKFSGRVRAEIGVQSTDDDIPSNAARSSTHNGEKADSSFLTSNFELVVNASSMTEVGMVVGQFAISATHNPSGGNSAALGDAWITIGENILVGRETSRFDFGGGYGVYDGGVYGDAALNQFTFIMPFGNGFSATLGLEDARNRGTSSIVASVGGTVTDVASSSSEFAGMEIPDIVASLRISQGWGSAQISGALHQLRISDGAAGTTSATAGDEADTDYGFAVQAGVELNVGAMTQVKLRAGYADGAIAYLGGGGFSDVIIDTTGGVRSIADTLDGWNLLASLAHDFGGGISFGATASYMDLDDQVEVWTAAASVTYEVVENLTVSLAGEYKDYEYDANYDLLPSSVNAAADGDYSDWEAKLRVNRAF